jgi:hypothetical protein
MENIWFDGGAWSCAWGGGVIQYIKKDYPELIYNYKNLGGYSAGGYLAINVHLGFEEPQFWHTFQHKTHGFGKYHRWSEECASRCWNLDTNGKLRNDPRLSLVIYSINKLKPIIRNTWKSKEDFINFTKGTVHIPGLVSKGLHYVNEHGWSVDGGLTHRNPPKEWGKTLIISPWRKSDQYTICPSKPINKKLLIMGDWGLCKKVFDQGIEDAKLWVKKYY